MKNELTKTIFCKNCDNMKKHIIVYRFNKVVKSLCLSCMPNNFGKAILHSVSQIEDMIAYTEKIKT